MSRTSFIIGSGTSVPETSVSNDEICGRLGLTPEQIYKSSGIRARRWASPNVTTSTLASIAVTSAIENAGILISDLDYLIMGTMTPDTFIPGSAPFVQSALKLNEIPCVDIRAACCNTLYGLQLADALIRSERARNVCICLADIQSPWLKLSPEAGTMSMLFGDGAAALIVSGNAARNALEIIDIALATDGEYADHLGIRRPGTRFGLATSDSTSNDLNDYFPRMIGQSVILQASRKMLEVCNSVLKKNGLSIDRIRWMVPHQANANLLRQLARGLGFSNEDGIVSVLENYGNTSSASMGMAIDKLRRCDALEQHDYLLLPAFAAGFTWGAALCRSEC